MTISAERNYGIGFEIKGKAVPSSKIEPGDTLEAGFANGKLTVVDHTDSLFVRRGVGGLISFSTSNKEVLEQGVSFDCDSHGPTVVKIIDGQTVISTEIPEQKGVVLEIQGIAKATFLHTK